MADHRPSVGRTTELVYHQLLAYYLQEGVPPGVRELARMVNRNLSTVQAHLRKLERAGWVRAAGDAVAIQASRGYLPVKDRTRVILVDAPDVEQAARTDPDPPGEPEDL